MMDNIQSPRMEDGPFAEGQKVIVRSRDAGVLYGAFRCRDGENVTLDFARQLWKWKTKLGITLIDLAAFGADPDGCKFSTAATTVEVLNACAIIKVSPDAAKSIEAVK